MGNETAEFKSLIECIKIIGQELVDWELKLKKDQEYLRQSEDLIEEDRNRMKVFEGLSVWILRRLDQFDGVQNFVMELKATLLVDGKLPDNVKEMPIGAFFELVEENFIKTIDLVLNYREVEAQETERFKKHYFKHRKNDKGKK